MSNLTLTTLAAIIAPVADFITSITWQDSQPVEVMLHEKALRHFGSDWYPGHPVWRLFDVFDDLGLTYGFME